MPTLTKKISGLFIVSLLVTACGGGGADVSSTTSIDTDPNTSAVMPPVSVNNTAGAAVNTQAKATMQELVAADDFLFTTKQSVQVSVSLSEYEKERAYISVYEDYQQLPSGRYYPDASSRNIAGNLQQGEFESSFVTINKQATFLVEVWFYDGQDALQKELTLANNKLIW